MRRGRGRMWRRRRQNRKRSDNCKVGREGGREGGIKGDMTSTEREECIKF